MKPRALALLATMATLSSALLLLTSCVSPSEKKQMKDDIFNTQTRLLNVEKLLTDNTKETKSTGESATKRIASNQAELERISREIQQLHGEMDVLRVGVTTGQMPGADPAQQEHSLAASIAKLNERLDAIEQTQEDLLDALKKAGLKAGGGKKKADSHKAASSVAELKSAFDEKAFKQVVDDAPKVIKESSGEDREHARFLQAESYFRLGKVREAALKFNEFVDSKPSKKFLPTAQMRIGDCFDKLGDAATAKLYYEELIKEFPDTDEAAKAKERLAGSGGEGPSKG